MDKQNIRGMDTSIQLDEQAEETKNIRGMVDGVSVYYLDLAADFVEY